MSKAFELLNDPQLQDAIAPDPADDYCSDCDQDIDNCCCGELCPDCGGTAEKCCCWDWP